MSPPQGLRSTFPLHPPSVTTQPPPPTRAPSSVPPLRPHPEQLGHVTHEAEEPRREQIGPSGSADQPNWADSFDLARFDAERKQKKKSFTRELPSVAPRLFNVLNLITAFMLNDVDKPESDASTK